MLSEYMMWSPVRLYGVLCSPGVPALCHSLIKSMVRRIAAAWAGANSE
jgi:hypothetical protein